MFSIKKILSSFVAAMASCFFLSVSLLYANGGLILGGKLIADMSNLKCYYPDSIASAYGITIMRGAISWNKSSQEINPTSMLAIDIAWSRTNDPTQATASVSTYSNPISIVKAYTLAFAERGDVLSVNQEKTNWTYCTISINTSQNPDYVTMAHEFGHVLGLGENDNEAQKHSIMYPYRDECTATKPAMVDVIAVNRIYAYS